VPAGLALGDRACITPSDVIVGYCAAAVWVGAVGVLDRTLRSGEREKLEGSKNI